MVRLENQYAALAPVMALSGMFAHPVAGTLLPLILFFIYYWRRMDFAALAALRAADLAFSIQLFLLLASVLLVVYSSYNPITDQQAHGVFRNITLISVFYLIVSFVAGAIQAFRRKKFKYILSLKIAERLVFSNRKA